MNKIVFFAALMAGIFISTVQASAMAEDAEVVNLDHKGVCKVIEGSEAVDGTVSGQLNVTASIKLEVGYADGRKKIDDGTPVFIFSETDKDFRSDYTIQKGMEKRFSVDEAGFFRILAAEIQTVDYPQGVVSYRTIEIKVCAR
jgi:hypothetical protein